jgi:RHS repeat-associated protein
MPGRKLSGGYRYGFNGKENDNEVKGEGNSQDYGMRIYDPRLGRFLSVDPDFIENRDLSTYSFAANNPIRLIDVDGRYPGEPTIFQEINILYDKLVYTYESSRASLLQSKSQLLKGGFNDLAAQIDIPHPLSKVDKIKMWRASQEIIFKHYGIDKYVEYASYLSAVAAFRKVIAKSGSDGIKYVIRQVQKLGKKEGKELLEELGDNPYFGKAKDEILRSKKSFEKLIKDHKEMLEKMRKDPRGMTKPEKLEQMTKDNPTEEVLMKRLKSQEKEILDQIKKQEGELKKVEQAYKHTQ